MAEYLGGFRSNGAYPSSSSTIHGFGIYVYFYWEKIEPGKTKITWKFQACYDQYGSYPATSTYAHAYVNLSLNAVKGTISNIKNTYFDQGSIAYKNWPVLLENGECILTHDKDTGEGSFSASAAFEIGGWNANSSSGIFILPNNMAYTKCGAPTSIEATGIITPSGSFTVSWSGATAGRENAISGYRVYYSLTSEGSAPTTSTTTYKDVDASATSTTFTLNNAARGDKIVCGVVTKGSISGFDSDIKTGGLVTINLLPDEPSIISISDTIVPINGGEITFTISKGNSNDNNQDSFLYYSTNINEERIKINSPWTVNVKNNSTFYFWTYDGLEWSDSYATALITVNTKIELLVSISGSILESANNNSGLDYIVSPTITVNASGGQANKKYEYEIFYGVNASNLNLSKIYRSNTPETQITIPDIRALGINHETNGAYYQVKITCDDGYDKVTNISSKFYITKTPSLIGLFNKADFSNVTGFYNENIATYYSKFLGFCFQKDEGYTTLKFNNHNNASQIINLVTNLEDTRGSWTTIEEISSSISHNLSYQLGYSSGYICSAITQNIIKIAKVSLSNFNFALNGQAYKFFTDLNTYTNTVGHSYFSSPLTNGAIKNYGINSILTSNHLFIKIYSNNSWTDSIGISPNSVTNNNTIGFNLSTASMANVIAALFTSAQKNSSYSSTVRLYIRNDFDDESWIDSNFIIDFIENDNIELTSIDIHPNSNNNKLDQWQYLKEGMGDLIGNFTIKSYNTSPKGEIQILRSTETKWQTLKKFNFSGSGTAEPNSPITYSISNLMVQTIGEISNFNYNVNYRLIVTTDAGSKTFTLYSNIPVRGHVPAVLVIQNNSYDGTNLTIGYNITNFGADITNLKLGDNNKISLYLDEETTVKSTYTDNSSNYFATSSKSAIFPYDFLNSESSLIKLGISTVLYTYLKTDSSNTVPYFGTTKTTNLSSITSTPVFNILPTVAYRKNHLGINILDPGVNSDAIIVIGEASGRDTIYFQPASTNLCKVVNFHLDGGTW